MTLTPSAASSPLPRWLPNPLNLREVDRVFLVVGVVLPLAAWYLSVLLYLAWHPQVATYIDREVLVIAVRVQAGVVGAWALLGVAALVLRRVAPHSAWFFHPLAAVYAFTICYFTYLVGPFTSMFPPTAFLAGVAIGLILFDRGTVLRWFLAMALASLVLIALTQARLLPYAPLLLKAPFADKHLDGYWILTVEAVSISLVPVTWVLLHYLISSWRDKDAELAETRDRLTRANALISQYVPAQLAAGILADPVAAFSGRHERRKITVFFSDVRGFSEIADKLEPEDLSRVLNEYLSEMTHIAERHGGTLDQFFGDGILVFFGAPVSTSDRDHALRAVRMGLEMQSRVRELSAKWQAEILEAPFEVRIGINTGYANVGNFGSERRMAYMAVGRHVNLAARLQAHCQPGRILISHATWLLVRDAIACAEKGDVHVKGAHFPVKTYEVDPLAVHAALEVGA